MHLDPSLRVRVEGLTFSSGSISAEQKDRNLNSAQLLACFCKRARVGKRDVGMCELLGTGWLQELMGKMDMNGFMVQGPLPEAERLGIGVFDTCALFNHSCQPSFCRRFRIEKGAVPQIVVYCKKGAKAGDEACIGYIEANDNCAERRQILWDEYKFLCKCGECKDEKTLPEGYRA